MNKKYPVALFIFILPLVVLTAGCATTQARRADSAATNDLTGQLSVLQSQVQAKDQEIRDLKLQIESMENSLKKPANFAGKEIEDKTSILHVSGVTVRELQNSLVRAGFDPGAVDGKIGKKTKKAVKDFQKKNSLKADGVVGEKTWALLKAQ